MKKEEPDCIASCKMQLLLVRRAILGFSPFAAKQRLALSPSRARSPSGCWPDSLPSSRRCSRCSELAVLVGLRHRRRTCPPQRHPPRFATAALSSHDSAGAPRWRRIRGADGAPRRRLPLLSNDGAWTSPPSSVSICAGSKREAESTMGALPGAAGQSPSLPLLPRRPQFRASGARRRGAPLIRPAATSIRSSRGTTEWSSRVGGEQLHGGIQGATAACAAAPLGLRPAAGANCRDRLREGTRVVAGAASLLQR
jgi:hypothetical protein